MAAIEIEYEPIVEILEDILGDHKMHNDYKGQISFDCPVCSYEIKGLDDGDGKGNLEVNYKYGVFKCWSCGETHETHGSIYKLIKQHGSKKQLEHYCLLRPQDTEIQAKVHKILTGLPKEFIAFSSASVGLKMTHYYRQAYSYIKRRNITDEMLQKYNIGFAYDGHYANRIIIPSYDADKKLNYFIARSYEQRTKMKYKNPDVQKEIIIFNEHLLNWDEPIYLVEGAFDSIFVPNSIPMLGKVMGEHLYSTLYEKAKEIIIVLDGDAWDDAQRLFHKLNNGRLFCKVWVVKMPDNKDIADLQGNFENLYKIQLD
jgi:DNA primase